MSVAALGSKGCQAGKSMPIVAGKWILPDSNKKQGLSHLNHVIR
jgi:hypothetical protein